MEEEKTQDDTVTGYQRRRDSYIWNPTTEYENVNLADHKHLVQPLAYRIYIKMPNDLNAFDVPEQQSFFGNVSIVLRAKDEIKYIIIGASDLRIASVTLLSLDVSTRYLSSKEEIF